MTFELPLPQLRGFLLDCEKFSQGSMWTRKLCIDEFSEFPPTARIQHGYLSCIWVGGRIVRDSAATWGAFDVKGASQDSVYIGISIFAYI
ncbi:hypothetical protein WOLCODRAFT_158455 [Wolfiporia cocos MD-104 SS10]|uniref:Uncharacterized protein n=1 Tax=Wolfiporia cocos (strain MD-104) TaxID=742152 RepID=A0A2H3JJH1_WOLCO|nr:hypothetical protein WOLCODRAFT_158455 [Wolfiporia cocos MD-104 SS10]